MTWFHEVHLRQLINQERYLNEQARLTIVNGLDLNQKFLTAMDAERAEIEKQLDVLRRHYDHVRFHLEDVEATYRTILITAAIANPSIN